MKRLFRCSIFETNSSAVHSMVVLSKDEYEEWKKNELYVRSGYFNELYTFDEAIAIADVNEYGSYDDDLRLGNMDEINEVLNRHGYYKYEDWFNAYDDGADYYNYTTKHGDEIVILSRYGYDG